MRAPNAIGLPALLATLVLVAAGPAHAQSKTGTTLGQFLLIEPSARVAAMGNAGSSLVGGLDAAYYNPASIAGVERFELVFAHSAWLADIGHDYVAAAFPAGSWGRFYATITSLGSGEIDVRTVNQPLGTGERYTVSNLAFGLGYGRWITDRFAVGGKVSWIQETIWHSSASTMTIDIGSIYRVAENGLHIGSSISNFGTEGSYSGRDLQILFDSDPDRFGDNSTLPAEQFTGSFATPVMFRVGLGLPLQLSASNRLQLGLDAFHPSDNTESVSFGGEWSWRDALALRAGYQNLFLEDSEVGLTAGAGLGGLLDVYRYRFDYAWAEHGRLGSTQRLSLGVRF
jgi:hypothetical protein